MSNNIWKKMKYFVMGNEEEYDQEFDEYDEEQEEEVEDESVSFNDDKQDRNIISDSIVRPSRTNLVDINNPNHMKVIVYKPTKYSDAEQIVKNLKLKKPVVVNLEEVEVELARKIFNFCSGAICALDGEMRKISKEIFILAPSNVTLDADKATDEEDGEDKPFDWRR